MSNEAVKDAVKFNLIDALENKNIQEAKEYIVSVARANSTLIPDKKTGEAPDDKDLYKELIPQAGWTMKEVDRKDLFDKVFIASAAQVFGENAIDTLAGNKNIDRCVGAVKMGANSLDLALDREKKYTNHLSPNNEDVIKKGVLVHSYEVKAGKGSGGLLKEVRKELNELAAEKLK